MYVFLSGKQMKHQKKRSKMSKIQDLPDELVLKILRNSETKDLISCGQVSQRIRKISHDCSLWVTANFERKIVKTQLLEMILSKGCKILNISNSAFVGTLNANVKSHLRVLDLSQSDLAFSSCTKNTKVFEELLDSCRSLQHLKMKALPITPKMALSICKNGKTLQKLNLNYTFVDESSYSDNQPYESFEKIIKWCQELKEVDLTGSDSGLNRYNLDFLVKNITPNIEKLNLKSTLFDYELVKILFRRCQKIETMSWAGLEYKCENIN